MIYCDFSESIYNSGKPKGPVCRSTFSEAVAAPTFKRGFVMSKIFWYLHSFVQLPHGFGRDGSIREDGRTASDVLRTSRPP